MLRISLRRPRVDMAVMASAVIFTVCWAVIIVVGCVAQALV